MPAIPFEEGEWYYTQGEKQCGPVSAGELKELALHGQVTPREMVWREGMRDWGLARDVTGLFAFSAEEFAERERAAAARGLFRDGEILVMRKDAPLPPRCIKTNEPTAFVLKRTLYYMNPWFYLLLLCHVLVFVIVGLIVRKSVTVLVPLSEQAQAARREGVLIGWNAALGGLGLLVFGIAVEHALPIIAGIIGLLGGMIYGLRKAQVVSAKRIDNQYAWVKGACPAFLAELPDWRSVRYR